MGRGTLRLGIFAALALSAASSGAQADCTVETRLSRGKYFPVIKCDESAAAIEAAMDRAIDSCTVLPSEFVTACYESVVESFLLREEAMLRRLLKEGATVEAAARVLGLTEEEVKQWIAANLFTSQGYSEPDAVPADVLRGAEDMATISSLLGLTP